MHSFPLVLALVLACLLLTATESPAPQSPQDGKAKEESTLKRLQELVLKGDNLHVTQDLNSAQEETRSQTRYLLASFVTTRTLAENDLFCREWRVGLRSATMTYPPVLFLLADNL